MDGPTGRTCDRCGARAKATYQRGPVTFDWCDHHAREHHPRLTDLGFVRHELAVQDVPPLVAGPVAG